MRFSIPRFAEIVSGRRSISNTNAVSDRPELAAGSTDYVRFIVLTAGRTGSMWLVEALNSHRQIICFGSVFEARADYVSFDVEGYDNLSAEDRALRDGDFAKFLRERVFAECDAGVGAVGFKLQYKNVFGFPGLLKYLTADRDLKVVHLRRRDLLRSLISLRLAKTTGHYHRQPVRIGWRTILTAMRHPARAVARLRVRLAQRSYSPSGLTLTKEECEQFFLETRWTEAHYDNLFSEHERLDILYEEMVEDRQAAFGRVQEFLGVHPRTLAYTQQPLNEAAISELLNNYDELRASFQGSKYDEFFT